MIKFVFLSALKNFLSNLIRFGTTVPFIFESRLKANHPSQPYIGLITIALVEPPLTDTSRRRTPLISGHLVMFSATFKHYIFNLPKADTSLKRTLFLVPRVSPYRSFDCTSYILKDCGAYFQLEGGGGGG